MYLAGGGGGSRTPVQKPDRVGSTSVSAVFISPRDRPAEGWHSAIPSGLSLGPYGSWTSASPLHDAPSPVAGFPGRNGPLLSGQSQLAVGVYCFSRLLTGRGPPARSHCVRRSLSKPFRPRFSRSISCFSTFLFYYESDFLEMMPDSSPLSRPLRGGPPDPPNPLVLYEIPEAPVPRDAYIPDEHLLSTSLFFTRPPKRRLRSPTQRGHGRHEVTRSRAPRGNAVTGATR